MDLSRPFNINVDYRDRTSPPAWELRIFAEVVLIDKTHDTLHPLVYELKHSMLPLDLDPSGWNAVIHKLPRDAFVCLGQATTLDKQKKQILLSAGNTVSYNYLIIVAGSKSTSPESEDEFSRGVQTLVGALRVKRKMPVSLAAYLVKRHNTSKPFVKNSKGQKRESSMCHIAKSVPSHLAPMTAKKLGINLDLLSKRLYEVLL
jgi:hypothetical protein